MVVSRYHILRLGVRSFRPARRPSQKRRTLHRRQTFYFPLREVLSPHLQNTLLILSRGVIKHNCGVRREVRMKQRERRIAGLRLQVRRRAVDDK
jgi:hypothetical protein